MIQAVRSALLIPALFAAGCVGTGPNIDRYRTPVAMTTDDDVANWSRDIWTSARAGEIDATLSGLGEPPIPDPVMSATLDRYLALDAAAMRRRVSDAERILGNLDPRGLDEDAARSIFELADLRAAGLPEAGDARVASAVERAIDRWIDLAERCERNGDFVDADAAWGVVGDIAIGSDRPGIMIEARRRQRRLDGLRGRPELDPGEDAFGVRRPSIEDAMRVLRIILKHHVDRPTWRTLVTAGLGQVEEGMTVAAGNAATRSWMRRWEAATSRLRERTADVEDRTGGLPSLVRRELVETLEDIASVDASNFGTTAVSRLFLDGVVAATDLRTNAYFGARAVQLRRQLDASFVGIGAEIYKAPGGILLQPMPGSPSAKSGLLEGDRLIAVDDSDVEGCTSQDVVDLITGRAGSTVRLTIARHGCDEPLELEILRGDVQRESVIGWRQLGVDEAGRPIWDWIVDPEAGIVFVSIREFREDVIRLFRTALRESSDALGPTRSVSGIVLDLRNDPGGLRWVAEDLVDLFVSSGTIFSAEGRGDRVRSHAASPFSTRLEAIPLVILVNDASASASEIVAGTLQASGDAVVVGERTYGKGSVQTVRRLVNGGYALVTESWFTIPDGDGGRRFIDRSRAGEEWGIRPDLLVGATIEETRAIMVDRGRWYSGIGLDSPATPDPRSRAERLAGTRDRELLLAVALLRARLLPVTRPSSPVQ